MHSHFTTYITCAFFLLCVWVCFVGLRKAEEVCLSNLVKTGILLRVLTDTVRVLRRVSGTSTRVRVLHTIRVRITTEFAGMYQTTSAIDRESKEAKIS